MVLWGWGERIVDFDLEELQPCQNCGQERDFRMRLKYEYGHFYHLFGWVIKKQYQLVCSCCTHGWILNTESAEGLLARNPIPFHQRNGWLVMIALGAVIAVATFVHRGTAW